MRVRFEALHSAESLGLRHGASEAEEVTIDPVRSYNVPLHLTSGTSIRVRPTPEEFEQRSPFPSESDARLDDLTREANAEGGADDGDEAEAASDAANGRALVVLQRRRTVIEHHTWGAVPDVRTTHTHTHTHTYIYIYIYIYI